MKFISISKRQQYLLYSIIVFSIGVLFDPVLQIRNFILFTALGIAVVGFVSFLYFRNNKSNYYLDKTIYLYIFLTCAFLLPFNFPNITEYYKVIYYLVMSLQFYVLLLAFNIYSVSEKYSESIPLLQPARLVIYVSTVLLSFLLATIVYKIDIFSSLPVLNLILKMFLYFGFFFILFKSLHWFFVEDNEVGEVRNRKMARYKSIMIYSSIVLAQFSFLLLFFPYEAFAAGIVVSALTYVGLSIIQGFLSHKLNNKLLFEYAGIIGVILFIAYFIS